MYSNSCCRCSFEPEIIKIGQHHVPRVSRRAKTCINQLSEDTGMSSRRPNKIQTLVQLEMGEESIKNRFGESK